MTFKARRPFYGPYGTDGKDIMLQIGQIFEVPEFNVRKLAMLEAKGHIERYISRPRVDRKAYTVYQNKALKPAENK